ncbi:D-alanyl-D-alanine carboxypeptidase family protein [Ferroacidibacillus organovorans]|uniref:serine-type D-Ala-D-Ala carboxypeptidase n=1 Tax=Ferroacidibacillus organovorans TaxID=1765683 RepID=A0A853KE06_9BACL|nr:D-alanyl-D-alanine carboxypeptidase family protein [Ferroacidibacillus organovorans]KYP80434.1 D-alanyl-D-alanine carboxypeptidase [Ferroacidibacillus organovorans]OAG94661.1 D-alanyl-D-alanine carboxypeptidase [Ferroacidibacillus organovorans]
MLRKWIGIVFSLVLPLSALPLGNALASTSSREIMVTQRTEPMPDLAPHAKSAVLMDAMTGTVFYAKNEHERLPIASVTKVATMLLVMEAIERKQLHFQDKVRTSDYAASMGGSQIFLESGETMTVSELMKGIALASGNDAAVAVAEHIAGSEGAFVSLMNQRARQLGLQNTHFVNANGLPAKGHYSSAFDLAVLSRELMAHESITQYTGRYQDHLRQGSGKPFWLVNTNKLIRFYSGMDGIKTGFTAEAHYCLAASAKRDHFRLIAVILGASTAKERNAEITAMMNYAFSHYGVKMAYKKGQVVTLVPVSRGELQAVAVTSARPVGVLLNRTTGQEIGTVVSEVHPLVAPVTRGQIAGTLRVMINQKTVLQVPLLAVADVKKVTWFEMLGRTFKHVFSLGAKRSFQ